MTACGTWVTCEEHDQKGRCQEVDPHTKYTSQINIVDQGGNHESITYDDQDPEMAEYGEYGARFFTTEDASDGANFDTLLIILHLLVASMIY